MLTLGGLLFAVTDSVVPRQGVGGATQAAEEHAGVDRLGVYHLQWVRESLHSTYINFLWRLGGGGGGYESQPGMYVSCLDSFFNVFLILG